MKYVEILSNAEWHESVLIVGDTYKAIEQKWDGYIVELHDSNIHHWVSADRVKEVSRAVYLVTEVDRLEARIQLMLTELKEI